MLPLGSLGKASRYEAFEIFCENLAPSRKLWNRFLGISQTLWNPLGNPLASSRKLLGTSGKLGGDFGQILEALAKIWKAIQFLEALGTLGARVVTQRTHAYILRARPLDHIVTRIIG